MTELEMAVEALKLCIPPDAYERALGKVKRMASHAEKADPKAPDLNAEIHRTLRELGVPAHIKGYRCLVCALELALENEYILECVTKALYPAVAEKCQTTPSRVERAIRHAIERTFDNGDLDVLYRYFGNTVDRRKGKPTNSEFLAAVANAIRLNARDSRG